MREQLHAIRVHGSHDPLNFNVLSVQAAIHKLVPSGMDWLRQPPFSQSASPVYDQHGGKLSWIGHAFGFHKISNPHRSDPLHIHTACRILQRKSEGTGVNAGDDAPDFDRVFQLGFRTFQVMNFGRSRQTGQDHLDAGSQLLAPREEQ